jgi:hypothetical protein
LLSNIGPKIVNPNCNFLWIFPLFQKKIVILS